MQDMKQQASETAAKLQDRSENVLNSAMSTVQRGAEQASQASKSIMDSIISPQRRERLQSQAQDFASDHPKLATFIAINLILTGIPVGLFALFTAATFLFSTVTGLVLGLLGAIVFTLMATGTALAVLLPTMMVTTGVSAFLFFWGLVVFYALRWTAGSSSSSQHLSSDGNWQTRSSGQGSIADRFKPEQQQQSTTSSTRRTGA